MKILGRVGAADIRRRVTYGTCAYDPHVVWVRSQCIERHVYDKGVKVGEWSQGVEQMEPTLSYQEPDTDPRHVEAVEPSLDVKSDPLSLMGLLPLEHALRDGCHCGVMTPFDGVERPGETFVELVDLWRPLCIRSRPCVIPATVKGRERSSTLIFFFSQGGISPTAFQLVSGVCLNWSHFHRSCGCTCFP